ncbi:centrin [Acrasis kona]|uniref:Centrin n=1 Tax=Acrasis kona TaxID=1008807 RepID=A0AAW2YLI1_9EUKA
MSKYSYPSVQNRGIRSKKQASFQLNDEQRQEITEAFDLFDQDKNGFIDAHEMKVAMRALGFEVKKEEVVSLMKSYDNEESGQVSKSDFLDVSKLPTLVFNSTLIVTKKLSERDPVEEIRKAFSLFDEDKTGKISLKNLKKIAREIGETMSEDELQAMIDEFDKDQDGMISEKEFLDIMLNSDDY